MACKSEAVEPQLSVQTFDDDREDDAARVVLVHGAMDRGASFSRVVGYLHDYVVTTYDRRGYAHSMDAPVAETLDGHIDDLIDILEGRSVDGDRPQPRRRHHARGRDPAARTRHVSRRVRVAHAVARLVAVVDAPDRERSPIDADDPGKSAESFMRFLVGDMAWEMLPMKTQQQRRAEGPALLADLRALRHRRRRRSNRPR